MTTDAPRAASARAPFFARWWTYQRERFPLAAHVPLIAAFSFCAVSVSAMLRGENGMPPLGAFVVAFLVSLLFFAQLRIADEWKDFEEDLRFRPYRPVPRGLVTLRELAALGVIGALIQVSLALWWNPRLLWFLGATWLYLALMSTWGARPFLRARPLFLMASHMLIVPLIDGHATACDWLLFGAPPRGLEWFLLVSYCNGFVIEIGRKIRAPEGEETGVETYSALWGARRATLLWLFAIFTTAVFALQTARAIDFFPVAAVVLAALTALALLVARNFLKKLTTQSARGLEAVSAGWTLLMYLVLGAAPLLWRAFSLRGGA